MRTVRTEEAVYTLNRRSWRKRGLASNPWIMDRQRRENDHQTSKVWAFWACQSAAQTKSIYVEKNVYNRAVARSENLGGHEILGGDNVPPWLR